jgi:hypothetical protein
MFSWWTDSPKRKIWKVNLLIFWATQFGSLAFLGSLWHTHILLFLSLTFCVTPYHQKLQEKRSFIQNKFVSKKSCPSSCLTRIIALYSSKLKSSLVLQIKFMLITIIFGLQNKPNILMQLQPFKLLQYWSKSK